MGLKEKNLDTCQYINSDVTEFTSLISPKYSWLTKYIRGIKITFWRLRQLGPSKYFNRVLFFHFFSKSKRKELRIQAHSRVAGEIKPELKVGDVVEVKSGAEILSTLDKHEKLRGLLFDQEMSKFCGKRFKIYKKVNKILVETTGELRTINSPTFLLEGVICSGASRGGCDRSCFCYWREDWLKKIDNQDS